MDWTTRLFDILIISDEGEGIVKNGIKGQEFCHAVTHGIQQMERKHPSHDWVVHITQHEDEDNG